MKYTVIVMPKAEKDLRDIYRHIYVELVSPQAALNVLNALEGSIMGLDSLPFRFRKYEHEPWRSKGLHIMPVGNYVVFYIPDKNKAEVSVLRVMYGGMDIDEQLEKL